MAISSKYPSHNVVRPGGALAGIVVLVAFTMLFVSGMALVGRPAVAETSGAFCAGRTAASLPADAEVLICGAASFIKDFADRGFGFLTDEGLSVEERRKQLRSLFGDSIAVNGVAKFALGRYWRHLSPGERDEYLVLFREVVVGLWADRLLTAAVNPNDFRYMSEHNGRIFEIVQVIPAKSAPPDENTVVVRSLIWTSAKSAVRVDWRVATKGKIFKITDVLVEGISMAITHRDEFASVIRANGGQVAALIGVLRQKRDQTSDVARIN